MHFAPLQPVTGTHITQNLNSVLFFPPFRYLYFFSDTRSLALHMHQITLYDERLRELGLFSLELGANRINVSKDLMGGNEEGSRLISAH